MHLGWRCTRGVSSSSNLMPGWPTRLSLVHIFGYCNSTHLLASLHLSVYVCVCVDACVYIYPFFFAKSKALLEIEKTVAIRQQEQATDNNFLAVPNTSSCVHSDGY